MNYAEAAKRLSEIMDAANDGLANYHWSEGRAFGFMIGHLHNVLWGLEFSAARDAKYAAEQEQYTVRSS